MGAHAIIPIIPCLIILLLGSGIAEAQIYRYQDDQGVVRFTNDRTKVPDGVTVKEMTEIASSPNTPKREQYAPAPPTVDPVKEARREKLGARKQSLDAEYQTLAAAKAELAAQKAAIPRRPRAKARKKHKVLNRQAIDLNQRIRDYEQRRLAFNQEAAPYNIIAQERLTEYENKIQR